LYSEFILEFPMYEDIATQKHINTVDNDALQCITMIIYNEYTMNMA
jgi:hypothetical protein